MTNGADILDFNSARSQSEPRRPDFNADEVRDRIAGRAFEFVEWLFPCAVTDRQRRKAFVGDINGSPGESLQIELTGPKAGYWRDWAHAGDEGKDLIGLYMASLNYDRTRDFPRAIKEIATEFLGESAAPKWTRPVTQRLAERAKEHEGKPRPNISERPAPSATYVYHDIDGGIVGLVHRHEFEELGDDGKPRKTFSVWDAKASKAQAPTPRPLYRAPQIARANHVVFVEGEKKADALASIGIEATCIMFGSNAPLDKVDWSVIGGKLVTFWPDNDESGRAFCERVIPILSSLGCRVARVQIPSDAPVKWDAADCLAEGGDAAALVNAAVPVEEKDIVRDDVFKLYSLSELDGLPPPVWLIESVMIENGLCLFWAGSDNYKTFVAIDMAMSIASGIPWQGKATQGGPVLYVAAEDIAGVKLRMDGWRRTKGEKLPEPDIRLLRDSFTMASPDAEKLIRSIELIPVKPRLIVIDTLAMTFGAGNEDKTSDMNAFIQGCASIRRATGATVMVVHHTGRNTEQERGNASLRAACDVIFTVQRIGKSGRIKLINTPPKGKQKNDAPFPDIHLRMQKVHFQQHDTEKSTLIVMADEEGSEAPEPDSHDEEETNDTAQRLGRIEKSILDALEKAARGGRDSLGFTSLHSLIGGDKGNFGRSLRKLVDKNLITQTNNFYARKP